jgi:hypothetical protein
LRLLKDELLKKGKTCQRNEGRSAARFCRQVAAWFSDMFSNFYLLKNHKITKNSATTKAREKNKKNILNN